VSITNGWLNEKAPSRHDSKQRKRDNKIDSICITMISARLGAFSRPACLAAQRNQTKPIQSRRKSEKSAGNRQQQSPPLGRWAAVFFAVCAIFAIYAASSAASSAAEWLLRSMKRAPVLAGREGTEGRKAGALAHNTRESACVSSRGVFGSSLSLTASASRSSEIRGRGVSEK